jgi:hypothetical protein
MSESIVEPNYFELHNNDTRISYSMESFLGGPQLDYHTQNLSREFRGEQIGALKTAIGTLITVLLEPDSDTGKEIALSLLLPTTNVTYSRQSPIETTAILTTQRTPRRGGSPLLEGQLQTYEMLSLTGTANNSNS